jgi:Ca2+-binding RTX toxin-like protein
LKDDWRYEIVTDDAHKFDAIQVEALTGTDTFSLGFFTYGTDFAGSPIELHYNIVATDGDADSVYGEIAVTLYPDSVASSGSNLLGTAGDDILLGTTGSDVINGAGGDDILAGNADGDTLIGGLGNDTMTGGAGSDTFVWTLSDTAVDKITDFTLAPAASGGDVLDLKDLLVGETNTALSLDAYLHFSAEVGTGKTVITVDANADATGGTGQTITLENVQFTALQAYAGGLGDDAAIITKLLADGNLKTDI